MIRNLLVLFLLTGLMLPALGQGRDTAFAVRKLFRAKRGAGEGLLAAGASVAGGTQPPQRDRGRPTAQDVRQDALAGTAFAGVGALKAYRYSADREAAVLKSYAEGWSIPADVRRKLKRKHFRRTTRDVLNATR